MIYLFYGEDTYSLKSAVKHLSGRFLASQSSDLNFAKLDGENLDPQAYAQAVFSMPFLGDKKLVIVTNIFKNTNSEIRRKIADDLEKVPAFTTLVFAEEAPDKREVLFKRLEKFAQKKAFLPETELTLRKLITEKFEADHIKIPPALAGKLILYTGTDRWRLENEINKLICYALAENRNEITGADIDLLVKPVNSFKIFDLTDALAQKNVKKAISILYSFVNEGEDYFRIFNLIIFQVRNMLMVADLAQTPPDQIAREAGIHPYVVKKTKESLRNFSKTESISLYAKLGEIDWAIKSGQSDAESAVDLFVVEFCER